MPERWQARGRGEENVRTAAQSLIAVYGVEARNVIMRHIVRCLDQALIDEVMFWLKVRDRFDWLMRTIWREGATIH